MSELPGRIGDYEIESELGVGGMAKVYKARHVILDTHHAIKLLDPSYRTNADVRQRFLDEAKLQAKHLDHPNIVKVTNIVATAEHAALVMELIDGPSLEGKIGELQKNPALLKRIMFGVLDAVGYAHRAGVVHRDLKPANVLLARHGEELIPKVTDFGIAKITDLGGPQGMRAKKSTHADARMGTLHYMSPEQVRKSKDVTPRSDVFSLGVMLFEMATGEIPFGGDSDYDMMENIIHGRYELPSGLDPVIAAVIAKALNPDPVKRFASCEEMAGALRGDIAIAGQPAPTNVAGIVHRATPTPRPRRWIPVTVGALLVGGGVVAFVLGRGSRDAVRPATAPIIDAPARVIDAAADLPEASPVPTPAKITLSIITTPSGAELSQIIDGLPIVLGKTPFDHTREPRDGKATYLVTLAGYREVRFDMAAGNDGSREITLVPTAPAPPRPRPNPRPEETGGLDPFAN